ncbi:hypothetical protein GM51_22590 [freshwater metagenome]|uniref:Alpha-D-phosphohexomutase alpha/beta/alpha domain-containing protein n=1 Tax=freshwater metagenome TaxID=449393 RepID=A0A094PK88_9ZZZZ
MVGHDMRDSSVEFVEAFIEGANARGADAINLGLCSTDECYFASGYLDAAAAMFRWCQRNFDGHRAFCDFGKV